MENLVKYSNRKIYSKKVSKYVSLDYIADLVKTNQRFQVIGHSTGEDLTKKTLQECLYRLDLDTNTMVELIRGN